ncbi:hypothetical protein ACROSR_03150 [Roseovarius tibetensis]|uniref:hypothetical protein n=1 Tax=Roseovarius tibetensis TaxID=2685897 RepID=UPI003D7FFC66
MAAKTLLPMIGAMALLLAGCAQMPQSDARGAPGPADVPPASFDGPQYVDRDGCVFIRAGGARAVRWVPRVSREGRPLCGAEPTFPADA